MNFKNLEVYFLEMLKGKRKGTLAGVLKPFLLFLSWIFQLIVLCRNYAYDSGWLCRYSPPVPLVISIGNIVTGGTGKTPVTLMLANEFCHEFTTAILSRGYRSPAEKLSTPVWLSKGEGPMHPASFCGDEPYLLSQNLPNVYVFVGKNRHKASNMAAKAGAQLILLDDGMQHRRLARDLEIVVMDACNPLGHGYFLPRGFLREGLNSLARADLIILNHVYDIEHYNRIKEELSQHTSAAFVGTRMEVAAFLDFQGNPMGSLQDKRVGVFCGIAHPEYFQSTLRNEGAHVIASHIVPDHMSFDRHHLAQFASACVDMQADLLVCTEKDRVKFTEAFRLPLPAAWVQMRLKIVEGDQMWKDFIALAKSDLTKRI